MTRQSPEVLPRRSRVDLAHTLASKDMTTTALPRLNKRLDVMSRGFAREGVFRQGVYQPGDQATIYDPTWTRQRMPEAVLRHEEVHQNLTQQTFHGVLTLILTEYGRCG